MIFKEITEEIILNLMKIVNLNLRSFIKFKYNKYEQNYIEVYNNKNV